MTHLDQISEEEKGFFTKSRILFLIVVCFVVSMPLIYRLFSEGGI